MRKQSVIGNVFQHLLIISRSHGEGRRGKLQMIDFLKLHPEDVIPACYLLPVRCTSLSFVAVG